MQRVSSFSKIVQRAALVVFVGGLVACGGASDSSAPMPVAPPVSAGVASVGQPVVGAAVEFVCAGATPPSVATLADGSYFFAAGTPIGFPCVLRARGGNVGTAAGASASETLYSVATASGVANLTPLTTLLTGYLSSPYVGPLGFWFEGLRATPANLSTVVTSATVATALGRLTSALAALPTPVSLPTLANPLTTPVVHVATDPNVVAINALNANLAAVASPLSEAVQQSQAGLAVVERTPLTLSLSKIGGYQHAGGLGAAEIPAYDPLSKRLFVINGALATVDVLSLAVPSAPTLVATITTAQFGANLGGANSAAVHSGVLALAIEANPKTNNGMVVLLRASDLRVLGTATVGALPDMLTFTPNGQHLLVANEGEPNSYNQPDSIDPEGSISVIRLGALAPNVNAVAMTVQNADFRAFNSQMASLRAAGVRISGPNATVAQDLEPEYITVSADSTRAYVTLQENNAIAVVDIATATVLSVRPLGLKDNSLPGNGLDVSDEDGGTNTNSGTPTIRISNYPIKSMYMPDAITSFTVGTTTYLISANEGDGREYVGINSFGRDDPRVREYCTAGLDPTVFGPNAAALLFDSALGRLRITSAPNGDRNGKNAAGQCNELLAYGGRSFSIWSTDVNLLWDSGDQFEQRTALFNTTVTFNASNDNNTFDNRSPAKGPEPEGVVVGKIGAKTFAFIGIERTGGVMVYDVSNPLAPVFMNYLNTRTGATGDRGPEGLQFIRAAHSPTGLPLLIVGNETSGTTAIFQINLGF